MSIFRIGDKVIIRAHNAFNTVLRALEGYHGTIEDQNLDGRDESDIAYTVRIPMTHNELGRNGLSLYSNMIFEDGDNTFFIYQIYPKYLDSAKILTINEVSEYKKLLDKPNRTVIDEYMIASYES